MTKQPDMMNPKPPNRGRLPVLDRYLTLWIFLAMGLGVALYFRRRYFGGERAAA